jgi:hypothetical protein
MKAKKRATKKLSVILAAIMITLGVAGAIALLDTQSAYAVRDAQTYPQKAPHSHSYNTYTIAVYEGRAGSKTCDRPIR